MPKNHQLKKIKEDLEKISSSLKNENKILIENYGNDKEQISFDRLGNFILYFVGIAIIIFWVGYCSSTAEECNTDRWDIDYDGCAEPDNDRWDR